MKVSVVIPAYDAVRTIDSCLSSILNQKFSDYEVIVVDGGSTNGTIERIKNYPVKLVSQSKPGLAAARNMGVDVSKGDIIIFLDGDCIVEPDLISNMVKPLENSKIGMTQGYIDIANPDSLIARLLFIKARDVFRKLKYLDFIWTGCVAIKKQFFQKVGKFNESLKFMEDDELAYRILDEGYRIYLVKKARFLHYFPESLWKHLKRQTATARWMVRLVRTSGRLTSQHGNLTEYFKLLIHGLMLLALPLILWTPLPFIILFTLSLASHLRVAYWAMKNDLRHILIIPFEFLTKLSWVAGSIAGLTDIILKKPEIEPLNQRISLL